MAARGTVILVVVVILIAVGAIWGYVAYTNKERQKNAEKYGLSLEDIKRIKTDHHGKVTETKDSEEYTYAYSITKETNMLNHVNANNIDSTPQIITVIKHPAYITISAKDNECIREVRVQFISDDRAVYEKRFRTNARNADITIYTGDIPRAEIIVITVYDNEGLTDTAMISTVCNAQITNVDVTGNSAMIEVSWNVSKYLANWELVVKIFAVNNDTETLFRVWTFKDTDLVHDNEFWSFGGLTLDFTGKDGIYHIILEVHGDVLDDGMPPLVVAYDDEYVHLSSGST